MHDALDNPQDTPPIPSPEVTEGPEKDPNDNRGYRRSNRLRPTDSTMDTGNDPVPTSTEYNSIDRVDDRDSDHNRRSAQDYGSRHRSSALTPLGGADERRSSPIRPPIKGPTSESPPIGEDIFGSDVDHDRRRRIQELEEDACLANERLKRAQDKLRSESTDSLLKSKSTSSPDTIQRKLPDHDSDGGNGHRYSRVSDENIQQAMRELHTPTRRKNETRSEYQARIAASLRIYLKQEELKKVERRRVRKQDRLRVEAESLLLELEEAERERNRHASDDIKNRRKSKRRRYDKYPQGREIRRREHYREWLATQNVLDSMREADLRTDGQTVIPARNKCPAYGGYPLSDKSDPVDRNATPGPSRPRAS